MPEIYVNGTRLSEEKTLALQQAYGQIPTGRYWYDPVSGLWGVEGRSVVGQIRLGLDLGGSLKTNASNGNTGVFINGRELPEEEFLYVQKLVGVLNKGRYWLDAYGNAGYVGGPAIVNLFALAKQRTGGGSWSYHSSYFGSVGGSGGFNYFIDKNSSWTSGD